MEQTLILDATETLLKNINRSRTIELIVLFIIVPILLALSLHLSIKLGVVALSLVYVIYNFVREKLYKNIFSFESPQKSFLVRMLVVGLSIFIGGSFTVYYYDSELLYSVVRNKPHIWIFILFVYTFLSVVPQEIVYRHFFYKRYESLFDNQYVLLLINMFCFSLCHLFLWNSLVLLLTFIGGGFFAYTYQKEKSMLWVCAEHALYGFLIFTVGAGEMLAFPT